jgi:uncharacterized membrane protein YdjX (TVP38/TMEM64 family)
MKITHLIVKHRGKVAATLIILLLAGWFIWHHRADLSRETLVARGQELHAAWFIAAFCVLPVLGFPLSMLLLLAGVRFGLGGGMVLATAGTIFHHFAAFYLAHGSFRDSVRRRLERAGRKIPPIKEKHRIWFTALFAAIHGPPYAAKLYLLALTDVPFRVYLWAGAPVYILFCFLPVGAGSAVTTFNPTWIYVLTGAMAALLLAGYLLRKRFGAAMDSGEA